MLEPRLRSQLMPVTGEIRGIAGTVNIYSALLGTMLKIIDGTRAPIGYSREDFARLRRTRESSLAFTANPVHSFVHHVFSPETTEGRLRLFDFGMGEAPFHPFPFVVDWTAIEPNDYAVATAIQEGRLETGTQIVSYPPPYNLDRNSLDGGLGISSFTAVTETQLTSALQDLIPSLKPGSPIVHMSDIKPIIPYLVGISPARLDKISSYLTTKYGIRSLHPGSFKDQGGFWGRYHDLARADLERSIKEVIEQRSGRQMDPNAYPKLENHWDQERSLRKLPRFSQRLVAGK